MGALQYPANRGSQMFDKNCAYLFFWHSMLPCNGSTIHLYNIANVYYGLSPWATLRNSIRLCYIHITHCPNCVHPHL
uniref:Uncharacterized protein n=1 Tax=Arundo donax TaxID=35708 RepID=A0A0A9D2Z1_ARUDO